MEVEFHRLVVAAVEPVTDDSVALRFEIPNELGDTFTHIPGQHVVIRAMIDGSDVRRSYSICSQPGDAHVTVGIKAIPDGAFSNYANRRLRAGDILEVTPPIGEFVKVPAPGVRHRYVAIAAGSGITPILSIVGSILELETDSHVTLLYGNRTSASIMFHEQLEGFKNLHAERFQLINVLSREPHQVELFEGRIDAEKIRSLADTLIDVGTIDGWYLCGPLAMIETVTKTLASLGVPDEAVHHELFFDQRIDAPEITEPDIDDEDAVRLEVTIDGRTSVVTAARNGPTVLDYARSVRGEVPFACKGGMCATCKARVTVGAVTMDKNYALTADEIDAGFVLTCQAHPTTDEVVLTFDT